MKLFPKTFLYTLMLLILIALLANGLIYILMPKTYTSYKQKELTEQIDLLVDKLQTKPKGEIKDLMAQYADALQANLVIHIGDNTYSALTWNSGFITESDETQKNSDSTTHIEITAGNKTQSTENAPTLTYTFTGTLSGKPASDPKTIETRRNFTMDGVAGDLTAIITLAPVDEAVGVIISLVPISLFMCVIVAVLFSLLYAGAITHPIKTISDETRKMKALDRNAKCEVNTKDEIGTLAANVNELYADLLYTIESLEDELQKVSAAERTKTDFLRAASHELKTPVTAVSVIMDNMILQVGKYKNHDEWLPKCKTLIDKLSVMLRDLLVTFPLEDTREHGVTDSIENFCNTVLEPYIMIARAKGLSIQIDWSTSFEITAPPKLLGKALSNVFSNAVQYTVPGAHLTIYCKHNQLFVENECQPLSKDQLIKIHEPFYRPDESRSRNTGGNGLGLYITDTILHMLGLSYHFEPMADPLGMRFTINF